MRGLWLGLSTVAFVLVGCTLSPPPEYPATRLRFDASLVGRWESKTVGNADEPASFSPTSHKLTFEIKSRDVPITAGRVDSTNTRAKNATSLAKGYTIIMSDGASPAASVEMHGYLFEAGGERLLGMQVSGDQLGKSGLAFYVLPLHLIMRPSIVGDELRLQAPKTIFAWMPFVGWIDAEAGVRREITWKPDKPDAPASPDSDGNPANKPVFLLTSDIDRLIEVYEKVMHEPGFWGDSETYRRVKE